MKGLLLAAAIVAVTWTASSESANAQRWGYWRARRPVVVAPVYVPSVAYRPGYVYPGYYGPSRYAYGYSYVPPAVVYPRPVYGYYGYGYGYGYYGGGVSLSIGF